MAPVRVASRLTIRLNAAERAGLARVVEARNLGSASAAVRLGIGMFLREQKVEGFAGKTDEELGYTEGLRRGYAAVNRALQEALKNGA